MTAAHASHRLRALAKLGDEMRRTRRLLLAAILLLLVAVGASYHIRRQYLRAHQVVRPKTLPAGVLATAEEGWQYSRTDSQTGKPIVEVKARSFEQIQDPPETRLEQVELRLYDKDAARFNEVKCAKAVFRDTDKRLYSEGDVEIRMRIPAEGPVSGRLLAIQSSGVTFDTGSGKASTDRPASFTFEGGDGKGVGAEYDPTQHVLHLKSAVELNWRPVGPRAKVMKVETGELYYREVESRIFLAPWSRLNRGTLNVEGGNAVVTLEGDTIRTVDASNASGTDTYPTRSVDFRAQRIFLTMDDDGVARQLTAEREAHIVSHSVSGDTSVEGDKVDLDFKTDSGESELTQALAQGHAVVNSKPVASKGKAAPETRIMRSEAIFLAMRPGGHELLRAATMRPGDVEFVPNAPGQRRRLIRGERLTLDYAARNRIEKFHATKASTRTDPAPPAKPLKPGQPPEPPVLTWSDEFLARVRPETGQLDTIDQTGNFRYQAGTRHATAHSATLDSPRNLITLVTAARLWDPSGSTTADRIELDQKSGDFVAVGKVTSTRQPEASGGAGTPMLDRGKVMQAQADRMTSRRDHTLITYDGNAILWQESNRIQADRVEIDRSSAALIAHGHVITRLVDNSRAPAGKKPETAVFTVAQAPDMEYSDKQKTAHYTGGVILVRPGMNIRSQELTAYLKQDDKGSSLDKAIGDGDVRIVQSLSDRTRTGTAQHAEYYVAEDKVILEGGRPLLVDSVRGRTEGNRLTYFASNERLLVESPPTAPSVSTLHRKKKANSR